MFLLSLRQGVPQWWHRSLKLFFILNLQPNISTFYAHRVTPYTLNELFHSALPWEYDVYVTYNLLNQEIQQAGNSLSGLPVQNQSSWVMLWCYTLFKVLYFSARSSRTNATGGHLDRILLELYLKGGGGLGTPRPALSFTFESNCKMAASEVERSISTILRKKRKGTVNSLSMS